MSISLSASPNLDLSAARRLVVLVPETDLDEIGLGRRVWELARSKKLDVLYLFVLRHWGDELSALHKATQLSAVTLDPRIHVETLVKAEVGWLAALKEICQPGDFVICDASQQIPLHIFWKKPLSSALFDSLHIPVIPISYAHPNGKIADLVLH